MSIELEQALINTTKRKKVVNERRLRYNSDTGEVIDYCHVDKTDVWGEPYIIIQDDTQVYPIRQRVREGKLVDIDTAIHVYWQATPAETIINNPYFCKRELEWKQ
jgi:hypothetical protein